MPWYFRQERFCFPEHGEEQLQAWHMCPKAGCLVTFAAYDGHKSYDITTFNVSKGFISFSLQIFNKVVGEPAVSINCICLKFPARQF